MTSYKLEIQEHAMAQHSRRDGAHVFTRNVVTPAQDCACFAAKDQKL
jgi:hypothetical protein